MSGTGMHSSMASAIWWFSLPELKISIMFRSYIPRIQEDERGCMPNLYSPFAGLEPLSLFALWLNLADWFSHYITSYLYSIQWNCLFSLSNILWSAITKGGLTFSCCVYVPKKVIHLFKHIKFTSLNSWPKGGEMGTKKGVLPRLADFIPLKWLEKFLGPTI